MKRDLIRVAYVTFDANSKARNSSGEYIYQCPYDVKKGDVVVVDTCYGPSLAVIRSTDWVTSDTVTQSHKCILTEALHIGQMTTYAKKQMDALRVHAYELADLEETIQKQRKEIRRITKQRTDIEDTLDDMRKALEFNENKLDALRRCR